MSYIYAPYLAVTVVAWVRKSVYTRQKPHDVFLIYIYEIILEKVKFYHVSDESTKIFYIWCGGILFI